MSGWLAYHSRRSQPAGTNEAVGQEGARKIELHLFNLYFLSSPPPAHPGSHNPHTHTLSLSVSVALLHLFYKWVILPGSG